MTVWCYPHHWKGSTRPSMNGSIGAAVLDLGDQQTRHVAPGLCVFVEAV